MTEPLTNQQLDEIVRMPRAEDIDVLVAEIRRLRAIAEEFRATFGNVIVRGKDGDWANIADYIATGARIPVCDAFYPHHTDTRCTKPKGHRSGHLAPWGTRHMAWPRDPRETPVENAVDPDICGDQNDDEVCDLDPGHDGDHCANATIGWAAAACPAAAASQHTVPAVRSAAD